MPYPKKNTLKLYNLPKKVKFCKSCTISNQRPRITFDKNGICSACNFNLYKKKIDWKKREEELLKLLDKFRSKTPGFDCIVPSSGGKDSGYVAHILKYKYEMNPLTITWAPHTWTDIGLKNYNGLVDSGISNILGKPNGEIHKILTKLSFIYVGDPFQPFVYGQANFPLMMSVQYNIPLIFYGENGEVEYGGDLKNAYKPTRGLNDYKKHYFSNLPPKHWEKYQIKKKDLDFYNAPNIKKINKVGSEMHFFSYYHYWDQQENFYYCTKNTNFLPNLERSEGTYSKYASLDDQLDGFHYYLMYIKFGIGRATSDSAHEIRDEKSINIKKNKTFLFSYLCNEFEKKFLKIQPDVIILFGDRYEILSAGIASMFLNIPIAHIHGGEITHGSIDDYIRHSITKISHIHFVASEKYKNNVIQLGENPKNVFNVGSLSADRIKKMKKINKKGLEKLINFNLDKDYFMVCIHPATIYKNKTIIIIDELFKSLDYFENYKLIITYPGFDTSYDYIVKKIKNYQKKNSERVLIKKNLGDDLYLNLLRNSKLIIGNSSSGIIDSPYLKVPTINIGDRQEGRLMSNSIINCEAKKNKIVKSIKLVLSKNFNLKLKKINIYYGRGGTAIKIIKKLKEINLENILIKKFFILKNKKKVNYV